MNCSLGSSHEIPSPSCLEIDSNEASINASANFSVKCSALDAAEEADLVDIVDSSEKFGFAGMVV